MRLAIALLASTLAASPAAAQVVSGQPNAASNSLVRQGEIRGLQQEQRSQNNAIRGEIQRQEISRPAPLTAGPSIIAPAR